MKVLNIFFNNLNKVILNEYPYEYPYEYPMLASNIIFDFIFSSEGVYVVII